MTGNMTDDYLKALAELIRPVIKEVLIQELAALGSQEPEQDYVQIDEAAQILGLSKQTLYTRTANKSIPFYKQGKRLYFRRSELLKWMEGGDG